MSFVWPMLGRGVSRRSPWRAPPRLVKELQVVVRPLRDGCFPRRTIAGCLPPLEPLRASGAQSFQT